MLTSGLTREFRLLVACSWAPPDDGLAKLCRAGVDWDAFLRLVSRHQVPALACRALERGCAAPAPAMEELRRLAARARTRSLLAAGECGRIARALSVERIEVLPLKGAPLSLELYGDPAARHASDVDLLVPEGDTERAEGVLQSLGYEPEFPQARMTPRLRGLRRRYSDACAYRHPRLQIAVDLHWDQDLWTRAQVDELWRRSEPVRCLGAPMRRLTGDALLLYLADHGAKHNWSRLKWLSDMAVLLARPRVRPWAELFELARHLDAVRALAAAAFLVHALYGVELAPELSGFVRRDPQAPARAAEAMVAMGMTQGELLSATRGQSILQKLRSQMLRRPGLPLSEHILRRWLHAEDLLHFSLPDCLLWLHYPLRPLFRRLRLGRAVR